jgi:hypothetical protein
MGCTGWKGEHTVSTLNTAVVPLLTVLPPSKRRRASRLGTLSNQRFARGAVDER